MLTNNFLYTIQFARGWTGQRQKTERMTTVHRQTEGQPVIIRCWENEQNAGRDTLDSFRVIIRGVAVLETRRWSFSRVSFSPRLQCHTKSSFTLLDSSCRALEIATCSLNTFIRTGRALPGLISKCLAYPSSATTWRTNTFVFLTMSSPSQLKYLLLHLIYFIILELKRQTENLHIPLLRLYLRG